MLPMARDKGQSLMRILGESRPSLAVGVWGVLLTIVGFLFAIVTWPVSIPKVLGAFVLVLAATLMTVLGWFFFTLRGTCSRVAAAPEVLAIWQPEEYPSVHMLAEVGPADWEYGEELNFYEKRDGVHRLLGTGLVIDKVPDGVHAALLKPAGKVAIDLGGLEAKNVVVRPRRGFTDLNRITQEQQDPESPAPLQAEAAPQQLKPRENKNPPHALARKDED